MYFPCQIGVSKDEDGLYYWTLNGEWMTDADGNKIKAVGTDGKNGADGEDGQDGADGTNGTNGANGADGKDGVTPQLKIENGDWMLSVDNGSTWTNLGTATGADGTNGSDGEDGDSFFSKIDYTTDTNWVVFTLADGVTEIKLPTWTAFDALQTLCSQMNANVSALQTAVTALQNGETITDVAVLKDADNNEIGYTITFKNAGAVNIYHGADGEDGQNGTNGADGANGTDGANGQDGATPVIGVAKDTDNIYYWTLNGGWLMDGDGNKIKAEGKDGADGTNGTNGADGANGTNGADGVTPKLKIENGEWYVSYDNESSWTQAGPAVDGDAQFFTSVTQDNDFVYLTLKGNTTSISIPKYKPLSITFSETGDIRVLPEQTYTISYTLTGATDATVVKALAQDGFRAVVDSEDGKIEITTPATIVDSEVLVFVSDGEERTIMASIPLKLDDIQTIEVVTAGNLSSLIAGNKYSITSLKLKGNINSDDIAFIRDMAGVASDGNTPTAGSLKYLDLSECSIVKGGGEYSYYSPVASSSNYMASTSTDANVLPNGMFSKTRLASVLLPNNLATISAYAFVGNETLTSVTIPASTTTINCGHDSTNGMPFAFSNIKSIKVEDGNTKYISIDGVLYDKEGKTLIAFPGGKSNVTFPGTIQSISAFAFYGAQNLTNVVLPNGLTEIPSSVFRESSVVSVVIPEGVTKIKNDVFYKCNSLMNVLLPNTLTEIGISAFDQTVLVKVTIPASVTAMYTNAFASSSLQEIHCKKETPINISDGMNNKYNVFYNVDKQTCKLYVPVGSLSSYKNAEGWKDFKNIEEE